MCGPELQGHLANACREQRFLMGAGAVVNRSVPFQIERFKSAWVGRIILTTLSNSRNAPVFAVEIEEEETDVSWSQDAPVPFRTVQLRALILYS